MSWTSPLTVASTIVPLPSSPSTFSMCGSRCATAVFITCADCSTNGSCIWPEPNSSPTVFMPASSVSLTIVERGLLLQRLVEVRLETVQFAVDDAALEPLVERQRGELLRPRLLRVRAAGDAGEQVEERRQRVVALLAPVVDQVEGDLALLIRDPVHREDLRGVHDGRIEPGLLALVQEDAVQHHARDRREAERDVGQAEDRLDVRVLALEFPDGVDRRLAVLAGLLLPGAEGEGQRVDEDVGLENPPLRREVGDQPLGDRHLVLGGARLALLVDREGDDGCAVLGDDREYARPAGVRPVAVLEVDRVDQAAAAEALEPGLDDGGLGGVEHDRQRAGGGVAAGDLVHVDGAVAADVVDADVAHVRAVAGRVAGDLDDVVPVAVEQRLAEGLRTVGVGPLPHHQDRRLLTERDARIERRRRRLDRSACAS